MTATQCLSAVPHSDAVVAGSGALADGVISLVTVSGLDLYNSASTLTFSNTTGVVDQITYPAPTQGASYSLDPSVTSQKVVAFAPRPGRRPEPVPEPAPETTPKSGTDSGSVLVST